MSYAVKEIFYTLQGEGAQTGRAAVFCRFAGCNLWSGREQDRAEAVCKFCDTDFAGADGPDGGRFARAEELAVADRGELAGRFFGGKEVCRLHRGRTAAATGSCADRCAARARIRGCR